VEMLAQPKIRGGDWSGVVSGQRSRRTRSRRRRRRHLPQCY